jgi:hypothetical protein
MAKKQEPTKKQKEKIVKKLKKGFEEVDKLIDVIAEEKKKKLEEEKDNK